jgi:hypothetical protein
MIEGLQFDVKTEELQTILKGRVEHHKKKSALYNEQYVKIRDEADQQQNSGMTNNAGSLAQQMKHSRDQHEDKAALFDFWSKHLEPNETYRLSESDLSKLEVTKGHMF